ncbi:MAG: NADH dehydrogenase subunit I [Syntrophus sp. PtaB.Bin075]|nr:MAG: NADH dehydrogenase subunit I [Syntrophus sp. PtaB.Bin075]
MKEIVVISGKGGTGKTSIVASFAFLAERKVLADCDVDAADLHLVLAPTIEYQEDFSGGGKARIDPERCIGCGLCMGLCRFGAISSSKNEAGRDAGELEKPCVNPLLCEGCKLCVRACPEQAIDFEPHIDGRMFISSTDYGPMVHAGLGIGQGNSGKLVALVREKARNVAQEKGLDLVIIDGSPGIGCPVIASITGVDLVLAVTEPTVSGRHDLLRVSELTSHFQIPLLVCVNKWDLNPEVAGQIEELTLERGARLAGRVRYDPAVTQAMVARKSMAEFSKEGAAEDIRKLWRTVSEN